MDDGAKILLGLLGVGVIGGVIYAATRPVTTTLPSTGVVTPTTGARTANALDTYVGTLTPPSGLLIGNLNPSNFGVSGATVTSITGAGTAQATVTMTAPPGMASQLTASLAAAGLTFGYTGSQVTDTGVAVQ